MSNQQTQDTLKGYPYLQGLQFACGTSDSVSVDVLIGADYYWSFFTGNIIKRDPSGPVALETKLGWVLSGPAVCPTSTKSCTVNLSSTHVLKIESTEISDMKDDLQKLILGLRNFGDKGKRSVCPGPYLGFFVCGGKLRTPLTGVYRM